jgi:hypothetical protein
VHLQRAYVGGGLQPGAVLVVICLVVVTLPPSSTAPTVAGCRLVYGFLLYSTTAFGPRSKVSRSPSESHLPEPSSRTSLVLQSETNSSMVNWHGTRGHGPFVLKVLPERYLALSKAKLRQSLLLRLSNLSAGKELCDSLCPSLGFTTFSGPLGPSSRLLLCRTAAGFHRMIVNWNKRKQGNSIMACLAGMSRHGSTHSTDQFSLLLIHPPPGSARLLARSLARRSARSSVHCDTKLFIREMLIVGITPLGWISFTLG